MSAHTHAAPPAPSTAAPSAPAEVKSAKLVGVLTFAGALAGALIVLVFKWAEPQIIANQVRTLQAAVGEVLGAPARTERFFIHGGKLVTTLPAGVDSAKVERIFAGYDAAGRQIGYAIQGSEPGFADNINLIFGYDAAGKRVLAMKVLGQKETPGLGDKIITDQDFVAQFQGAAAPLLAVKSGQGKGQPNEVDLITGATISSRILIGIINHRIEAVAPLIEAYRKEGGQ